MSTVTLKAAREHRVTVPSLQKRKGREPIAMLTAYDFTFARIFDAAGIDVLLVGDSLGNVVQGHDTTLPVTLDETVYHTRLVARAAQRVLHDARAVEAAGAFAVVLEGMPADLAREVTRELAIPTIGIGAGVDCDGQVLVMHDMLGLSDWTPSFVKAYAGIGVTVAQAARRYAEEVRERKFPDPEHSYR